MNCAKCSGLMVLNRESEILGGSNIVEFRCVNCGNRSGECLMDGKPFVPTGTTRTMRGKIVTSNGRNQSRPTS